MSDINLNKKASERLKADASALKIKKKLKKDGDEVAFHLYTQQYGGTYEDFLEYKKQEKKKEDALLERGKQRTITNYNALSTNKKQKTDEFITILGEDLYKNWYSLSEKEQKKKWSKIFRKQWWQFWIVVPDVDVDWLLNIK